MSFYKKYILPRFLNFAMSSKELEVIREKIVPQARGSVLEIGFGAGHNLTYYQAIDKLFALEPSNELFTLAQQKISRLPFLVERLSASVELIPLPDNSIDTIVSTWVLCSVHSPQKALQEISRVLKPNGQFIFVEHGKSPRFLLYLLQRLLTPFTRRLSGNCHLTRDIQKILTDSDLTIVKLEAFQERTHPLMFNTFGKLQKTEGENLFSPS